MLEKKQNTLENPLTRSIEDFLKQSCEIQQEIENLGTFCRNMSPGTRSESSARSSLDRTEDLSEKINKEFEALGLQKVDLPVENKVLTQNLMFVISQLKAKDSLINNLRRDLKVNSPSLADKKEFNSERNPDLLAIFELLEVHSVDKALDAISQLQKVVYSVPPIEKFIDSLCYEVYGENKLNANVNPSDILQSIRTLKKCKGKERDSAHKKTIKHFRKLFQVDDDDVQAMEQLFWFVYEVKQFLHHVRHKLKISDSVPVKELLHHIYKLIKNC